MDYESDSVESNDDIFIKPEKEKTAKGKPRQRKPREMSEETRQRMLDILAKGREKKMENSRLKRETLEENKKEIRDTIKSKVKEVRNQLKKELIDEGISKKKKQYEKQNKPADESPKTQEPTAPKAHRNASTTEVVREPKPEPIIVPPEPTAPKATFVEPEPTVLFRAHRHAGTTEVVPEPPKAQPKQTVPVKSPASAPIHKLEAPKPNLTAEYMRKLRAAYNF
jgi:hypothetical protein